MIACLHWFLTTRMPLKDQQQLMSKVSQHLETFAQIGTISHDAMVKDLLFLNVRSKHLEKQHRMTRE
jgi:hypothetical protein